MANGCALRLHKPSTSRKTSRRNCVISSPSCGNEYEARIFKNRLGSTGDSPGGRAATVRAMRTAFLQRSHAVVPVGGAPTRAGESPALPNLLNQGLRH